MKKKVFFFAAMFGSAIFAEQNFTQHFQSLEIYNSAQIAFPKNLQDDMFGDAKYIFSYGAKLHFTPFEFRYFNSCDKTEGNKLYEIKNAAAYSEIFDKARYSILIDLKKFDEKIDAKIATGSLSVSSRMKNPALSYTVSPFVSQLSDAAYLYPAFPTKTSTKKDPAIYGRVGFHFLENASNGTFRFMPLYAEFFSAKNQADNDLAPFVLAVRGGFLYKNFLKVTSGIWFERYCVEQKTENADIDLWGQFFTKNSSFYNSFMFEETFAIPFFKNKIIFAVTENSQNLERFWLRDEMLFKAGSFALSSQFFLSDNVFFKEQIPIIGTDNKKKYSIWQVKFSPELCVFLKKGQTLKFGSGFYFEEKIQNYEKKDEHTSVDAKFSTGAKFSGKKNSLKAITTVSAVNLKKTPAQKNAADLPKITTTLSYSHKFPNKRRIAASGSVAIQLRRDEKNTFSQKAKIYYYPKPSILKSIAVGASAEQKTMSKKGRVKIFSPYAKATFCFKAQKIKINADIKIEFNFESN